MAAWCGEFNDGFRRHEIPFSLARIERGGQPVLDAGCGAGRFLVPYLQAGLDVDGCDQSADMLAVCPEKATGEGIEPNLYVQPMHAIEIPRKYRTIIVVGSFGLGSDRQREREALVRLHDHLEPGGTLLIDVEVDPLEQRVTMEIRIQRWRDDDQEAEKRYQLDIGMYFKNVLLLLDSAGFTEVSVYGEHEDRPPTSDDDFIVFAANV